MAEENGSGQEVNSLVDLTIQGLVFKAPQPYGEGHVLTAVEASVLNQTFAENLRNNFAPKIKSAIEDYAKAQGVEVDSVTVDQLDKAALDVVFDNYSKEYTFGVRRGGRILDPVEKELRGMAEEIVRNALKAKGYKLNSIDGDKMEELISGVIEARPELRQEAERRVAAVRAAADVELGDLGKAAA